MLITRFNRFSIYKFLDKTVIFLWIISQNIDPSAYAGVVTIPVSGDEHAIFDSTQSSQRVFSIGSGADGSLTLQSGIFDAREDPPNNIPTISVTALQPNNLLQNYTINITTAAIANITNPVIDMSSRNLAGTINIINGSANSNVFGNNNAGVIYRTTVPIDNNSIPVSYGAVINFKNSTAKLNLLQTQVEQNIIYGDLYGSDNGDEITIQGGKLLGRIILGNGSNKVTLNNNAILDVTHGSTIERHAIISGTGVNTFNIGDQAKIIAGKNKHAIYAYPDINTGINNITITGTPKIIGGFYLPTTANVLNIGSNTSAAEYSTNGDLTNIQKVELNAPINFVTKFQLNHKLFGANILNIGYNSKMLLTEGHVVSNNNPAATNSAKISNYGELLLDNASTILGLSCDNNKSIYLDNNSSMRYLDLFNNRGTLRISNGSDLSGMNGYDNLTNEYGNKIIVDPTSSVGKISSLGAVTNFGTMEIHGQLYLDTLINNQNAAIVMAPGANCNVIGQGLIDNNGEIRISAGSSINAINFRQNNNLKVYGRINAAMRLGERGSSIEIIAGEIGEINGGTSNKDEVDITGPFISQGEIINVPKINIIANTAEIKHLISGLQNVFLVNAGSQLYITEKGNISGSGEVNNLGLININKPWVDRSIATSYAIGKIKNQGVINSLGGYFTVEDFSNNAKTAEVNIQNGGFLVNTFNNISGSLNIKGGDLSVFTNINNTAGNFGVLNNAANQVVLLSNNGRLGYDKAFQQLNNYGFFNILDQSLVKTNNFTNDRILSNSTTNIELNIIGGQLQLGTDSDLATDPQVASEINNNIGSIKIGSIKIDSNLNVDGDLSSSDPKSLARLRNGKDQLIELVDNGSIGKLVALGEVINLGKIIAGGGNVIVGNFTNGDQSGQHYAELLLNKGIFKAKDINNSFGTIRILNTTDQFGNIYFADLSSASQESPSVFVNGKNQIVEVITGTIGANGALGTVTNNGVFNCNDDVQAGMFNNQPGSKLNITRGTTRLGDINNSGNIVIDGDVADLSSINADLPSVLYNDYNQTISVLGNGTIGATAALGRTTNLGVVNANGGDLIIGDLVQGNRNEDNEFINFNLTSGRVFVGNIVNYSKNTINISGGDLSSHDPANHSNLDNRGGNIIVADLGSIGKYDQSGLGTVTNYPGVFRTSGIDVNIDLFKNGFDGSIINQANIQGNLEVIGGNCKIGTLENIQGNVKISAGDLSSNQRYFGNIINHNSQKILINGFGTIGTTNPYEHVTNYGMIMVNGGQITVQDFYNLNHALEQQILYLLNTGGEANDIVRHLSDSYGITISNSTISNIVARALPANITTLDLNTILASKANTNFSQGQIKCKNFYNLYSDFNLGLTEFINYGSDLTYENIVADISAVNDDGVPGSWENTGNISIVGNGTVGKFKSIGDINNFGTINISTGLCKVRNLNNYNLFNLTNNAKITKLTLPSNDISIQNIDNKGQMSLNSINHLNVINVWKIHNFPQATLDVNSDLKFADNLINESDGRINLTRNLEFAANKKFFNYGELRVLQPVTLKSGDYELGPTGKHVLDISNHDERGLTFIVPKLMLQSGDVRIANGATIIINNNKERLIQDQEKFNIIEVDPSHKINIFDLNTINVEGGKGLLSYALSLEEEKLDVIANKNKIRDLLSPSEDYLTDLAEKLDNIMNSKNSNNVALKKVLYSLEELSGPEQVVAAIKQFYPELEWANITLAANNFLVAEAAASRLEVLARSNINPTTGYAAGNSYLNDGLWIKGLLGSIKQSANQSYAGYKADSKGIIFGLDTEFWRNFWIGIGFSNVNTKMRTNDVGNKLTDLNSTQITAYTSFNPGDYYVDLFSSLALNLYKTSRHIHIENSKYNITAKFKGVQPAVKLALGKIYQAGDLQLIPNSTLQYSSLFNNPYNEDPVAIVGLNRIASERLTQLELGLGLKLALSENVDIDQSYSYYASMMFLHDFKNVSRATTAQFIGGGVDFKVIGATHDSNTYNLGIGFCYKYKNRLQLSINYDLRKKNKFIGHLGAITVRYDL